MAVQRGRAAARRRRRARRARGRRRRRRARPRNPRPRSDTAHCGMPKRKLMVPSSGSTTQRMPLVPWVSPPSSPSTPSSGPRGGDPLADQVLGGMVGLADTRSVGVDLAEIRSSGPRKASRSSAPASRATDSASAAARWRSRSCRHRRTVRGPVAGPLELGGERDEQRFAVGRTDELGGEREAVAREARGHAHRGLTRVVERGAVGRRGASSRPACGRRRGRRTRAPAAGGG